MSRIKTASALYIALLPAVLVCCPIQAAIVYDASAGFDAANNPSTLGPWSYGSTSTLGGSFSLDTVTSTAGTTTYWHGNGIANTIGKNLSGSYNQFSSAHWQPLQVTGHPGQDGQFAVLRFTALFSDLYDIDVAFSGNDDRGTTTDVHVLVNNGLIFNGFVNSAWTGGFTGTPGAGPSFSTAVPIPLSAGATIDFVVGRGVNNTFFNDTTGIVAQITATGVPEANAFLVIAVGAVFVGAVGKVRQMLKKA
jgi:hypothetical protein